MAGDPAAALAGLRRRFLQRAADDLDVILHYLAGEALLDEMRFAIHRMNGAAGTFGFSEVSVAASWVETDWPAGDRPDRERLDALISALRALPDPDGP